MLFRQLKGVLQAFYALYADSGDYNIYDISDYIASNMQDPLSRVDGVGKLPDVARPLGGLGCPQGLA